MMSISFIVLIYLTTCSAAYGQIRNSQKTSFFQNTFSSSYQVNRKLGCPEKTGRFPTEACDGYIECVNGISEEKTCPDGLLFNVNASIFSYPCQYPNEVDCIGRTKTQPPQPTDDCPHQFGFYKYGDSVECGKFLNCANGVGYVFDCPEGLAFNEEIYKCDWPDQVPSCDAEAFLRFSCPLEARSGNGFENGEFRFYKSNIDCSHYFLCINGRPRLYKCEEGKVFNELSSSCEAEENVPGCSTPYSQSQIKSRKSSPSPFQRNLYG